MDVIKKFFANFSRCGTVSIIPIKKVQIYDIKKVELRNNIGTPTVIHGQNVNSINNVTPEPNLSDRNDLKSDRSTTEGLKEFDEILKEINTVTNNGNPSLDEIDDVIREESQILEIPRFDLQYLSQGCDSNNKFFEEVADENDIIDDALETNDLNNFLTLDNIHEIIDLDEVNEPGDVATNSWKDDVISISSEDSQIQELTDKAELDKLRSDNDINELSTKLENINENVNKVGNYYNGVNEINETTVDKDLNIEANETKNINEEIEINNINETDKNEDDKFKDVNNESQINDQATNNFVLDDSDCGYRSSDFEFITEEEAKMDGLIVHFRSNKLKRNVMKLKRVKTIEVAVDKFSKNDVNKSSLNAMRLRPRLQIKPRNNKCRTCNQAKSPDPKPNGHYINRMQVKIPKCNNFRPNNIQNCSNTKKFTPNILRLVRKHPRMNNLIPKPTNLTHKDPELSYTSTCIQNNIVPGPNKENIEVSDNELVKENTKHVGKNSHGPTIQLACTQQSNLLQINYPEPNQENVPNVDTTQFNDFDPRQENYPIINIDPSSQNYFGQENVPVNYVDPSSQNDFGPWQENVSIMNIDPYSRNALDLIQENVPDLRMYTDPCSQNDFDLIQENVPRMNVDPSTQNDFGPRQENVPGLNNVDPGPNRSQENSPRFIYFGQNTSNEVPQQNNFGPGPSIEVNVPRLNNLDTENSDVHEDLSFSNAGSRTSNSYNMSGSNIEKWRTYQRRKQLNRQHFFLDYSYRENHRILNGDDYHQLFDPNCCPLPNRSVRLLENKSIMSTMLVEYQGVGFDMRMMRENIEIEDEEVKQQAAESARKILEMYPVENKKRRRRF